MKKSKKLSTPWKFYKQIKLGNGISLLHGSCFLISTCAVCYASAFRHRRHYVFGLVVRPKPEIPSSYLYMGPLVYPTNRDRFRPVRPSVRRGLHALSGEFMEGMASTFACWCILTTYRTVWILVTVCWFFYCWRHFDLVKPVKLGVSGYFPQNPWREWSETLHADVSWPPSKLQIFLILALFWLSEKAQIWGFRAFPGVRTEDFALIFCMLPLELIRLWSWSVNFALASLWFSERGQIWGFRAFSGERMEGMAYNLACWCIPTTFKID